LAQAISARALPFSKANVDLVLILGVVVILAKMILPLPALLLDMLLATSLSLALVILQHFGTQ